MNTYYINNYIIKNFTGEILRFYLDKNNRINYDLYDNNCTLVEQYLVSDDAVNNFSLDIDNRDRIHLIYLTNEGKVIYSLYSNKKWAKKTLTQFDVRSNSYGNLTLRVCKENIHILFSFSNLINPKVWTIQHLIGTKGNWEKTNVISFTSGKTIPLYFIDFDKFDNIHLIYTSIEEGTQKINYTFFNSSFKKWNLIPKLLSTHQSNSHCPNILVDKIDNIHVIWLTQEKNSYEVNYKFIPQLGNNRNTWKEEKLPLISSEYTYPIIYEEKETLRIYLKEKSIIHSLVSYNHGFNWTIDDAIVIPPEVKIFIAKYLTNFPSETSTQKVSQIFFHLDDMKIYLKQNLTDYFNKHSYKNDSSNKDIHIETEKLEETMNIVNDYSSLSVNKEENVSECLNMANDMKSILHALSDISRDIISLKDISSDFISQLINIDNTLLALKESIDINNQCFIDIDKKIDESNNKNPKKGFWSRFFKHA